MPHVKFHGIIPDVSFDQSERLTLEQLTVFVAVAERQHLTEGAKAMGLTPSAASAAIKALEDRYNVHLFDRIGRRIQLTRVGSAFLEEARATLASSRRARQLLSDLGGLHTGTLDIEASQTIANYWLPERMLGFARRYPGVTVGFRVGNTSSVVDAVISGRAELGFIEGTIDEPALSTTAVYADELAIVVSASMARSIRGMAAGDLGKLDWVMREPGSGTRAEFELALAAIGVSAASLHVSLTLPTNEAVLSAVRGSTSAAALSKLVILPFVKAGELVVADIDLPPRQFTILRHKQRRPSSASDEFRRMCLEPTH